MSSDPTLAPSTLNWTPATDTLSEAVPDTVIVPVTEALAAGERIETVGAVRSLLTVMLIADEVVVLPAASRATAVIE